MDNRAIGIFDSGVGGLTCVAPILEALPGEKIIYFGDTARTPYGSKSPETVKAFSLQIADFLSSMDIKVLVIACNTVTATAMEAIKKAHPDLMVIGTIEPAAKAIARGCTEENSIGIIATKLTTSSGAYEKEILAINPRLRVHSLSCPALVPMIEEGLTGRDIMVPVMHHYMNGFKADYHIDTLVLGCTHYPIVADSINTAFPDIRIINASKTLADAVVKYLTENGMTAGPEKRESVFYASDLSESFIKMIELITPADKFRLAHMSLAEEK